MTTTDEQMAALVREDDQRQRDAAIAEADRVSLLAEIRERTAERDRARAIAVDLEQQLDLVRAELVAFAGEVRGYIDTEGDYGQGHYQVAKHALSMLLERIGERYPDMSDEDAADELAKAFDEGTIGHASEKLPVPLDLEDEAREEARLDELSSIAGWSA